MDTFLTARWNFPKVEGLLTGADGGSSASNFRGDPIKAIGKENLQNPIDARPCTTVPARVEFSFFTIPASQFPGRDELEYAILMAKKFANPEGNSREESFYAAAEKYIALDEIPCLRISDFNTSGLCGSDAKLNDATAIRNSNWLHLVRGMGMTTKRNGDGGSHGKGKSAAIANSALSTIFYSTIDVSGKQAFQGVAYLPLFIDDDLVSHSGIGFFGTPDTDTSPIRKCYSLDPDFLRVEPGTDIFITGFCNQDEWEDRLLVCVLNEYLLAIYKEILEVKIGNTFIDKAHLPELIIRYVDICKKLELDVSENYADACWEAITNPELSAEPEHIEIEGMPADLQMYVRTGVGPKKTDQIRQIGMRICYKDGRRQFPFPFVGCLYINGTEINQFLAGLEDETHSKWEASRAGTGDSSKKAQRCLNCLNKYISEKIGELYKIAKDKKLDAEGMEEYFPIDLDEVDANGMAIESPKPNIASIRIKRYTPASKTEEYNTTNNGDDDPADFPAPADPSTPEPPDPTPPVPDPPAPTPPVPDPPEPPSLPPSEDPTLQDRPTRILKMKRKISIGSDGIYILALQGAEDHDQAYVQIILAGEEKDETPKITSARLKGTGESIAIQGDLIGPISISSFATTKIEVQTEESFSYSLGVNVYAY